MLLRNLFGFVFVVGALAASPVFAQDSEGQAQSADKFLGESQKAAEAPAAEEEVNADDAVAEDVDEATLAKKLALARDFHVLWSTHQQIDDAIRRASYTLPPKDREGFIAAMTSVLNYNAIDKISIDAMVDTFTLDEIQAMVDYYRNPAGLSAMKKTNDWGKKVQPEVTRMIDKAMMKVRTGGLPGDSAVENKPAP
ncbi:MAG: DUF2059 domain-containing protein [Alphaproteobacteria bacterium]|nr:DUF2059 domain-containing protein [Alphaproteobacteria bacterium]